MKVKRYKHARKVLSFYKHTFGVHEPYQVLGEYELAVVVSKTPVYQGRRQVGAWGWPPYFWLPCRIKNCSLMYQGIVSYMSHVEAVATGIKIGSSDQSLFREPIKVPYSGKLSRKKTSADWWKIRFSWRKLSRIATKPRNSRKFSPSKVFCYTVTSEPWKSNGQEPQLHFDIWPVKYRTIKSFRRERSSVLLAGQKFWSGRKCFKQATYKWLPMSMHHMQGVVTPNISCHSHGC